MTPGTDHVWPATMLKVGQSNFMNACLSPKLPYDSTSDRVAASWLYTACLAKSPSIKADVFAPQVSGPLTRKLSLVSPAPQVRELLLARALTQVPLSLSAKVVSGLTV